MCILKKDVSLHPNSRRKNGVEWCNGSTADFGSACQGSNPCSTTNKMKTCYECNRFFYCKIMITKEHITALASEALENSDRFVVDLTVSKSNVISIYIDADSSVTIDHCVELSRFIEGRLDREIEDYELSVSSAGIDYPLLKQRQLNKYIGKELEISDKEGIKKVFKLLSFNDEQLTVQEAVIKKLGKLKKITYSETLELYCKDIKEIKPYINF